MSKRKALVVEDNLEIQLMLTTVLSQKFEVDQTTNGRTALKMIQANPPDLIIMDVNVPGVDGFSLCKLVKDDPLTTYIKVIILTAGYEEAEGRELAQQVKADAFLTKPVRTQMLLEKATELLSQ